MVLMVRSAHELNEDANDNPISTETFRPEPQMHLGERMPRGGIPRDSSWHLPDYIVAEAARQGKGIVVYADGRAFDFYDCKEESHDD